MASPLAAEVGSQLILSGRAEKLVVDNRVELGQRNQALIDELKGFNLVTKAFSPHAWLLLPAPWTASQFCAWTESVEFKVSASDAFNINRCPEKRPCLFLEMVE